MSLSMFWVVCFQNIYGAEEVNTESTCVLRLPGSSSSSGAASSSTATSSSSVGSTSASCNRVVLLFVLRSDCRDPLMSLKFFFRSSWVHSNNRLLFKRGRQSVTWSLFCFLKRRFIAFGGKWSSLAARLCFIMYFHLC